MRICFASLHYDPGGETTDLPAYLERVRTARDLPGALAARGHEVHVVHVHPADCELVHTGVRHHFVAPGALARIVGRGLSRCTGLATPMTTPAWQGIARIRAIGPDIIHTFGTTLHLNQTLLLGLGARSVPTLLHYHGGGPARTRLGLALQRLVFSRVARVLFTTAEQATVHARAGLFADGSGKYTQITEGSSGFTPQPRADARRITAMTGAPVFLSAARLDRVKDPLTVLRGFARVSAVRRDAQLYLYYLTDEMLPEARGWVDARPEMRGRVHFRGRVPYAAMEAVYNSADFLLQASRREHSGFALLDAMACGVIPVVTDIPSFRVMTGNGRVGALFPCGDDAELARRVEDICRGEIAVSRAAVRARFDEHLSYPALAQRLESEYRRLV